MKVEYINKFVADLWGLKDIEIVEEELNIMIIKSI